MAILQLKQNTSIYFTVDDHTDPWLDPEVVVFVHGFGETSEAWRCWVPHFSRRFRVIRYDQWGFGQSSAVPAGTTFSTERQLQDLAAVVREASPSRPVHLVGWKSAGITLVKFAAEHPELVRTLSLVAPAIKGPDMTGWFETIERGGMMGFARESMQARLGDMPQAGVQWWTDMMGRTDLNTTHAYLRWVAGVDMEPELKRIRCPTFIIANDTARRGAAEFMRYKERIADAELELIKLPGYHAGAIAPDRCAEAVLRFIERRK